MSDIFKVKENSSLHKYRTELPNIIYDLGLSGNEFMLYAYYKKIAGDGGACWQSSKTICEKLGIAVRTLRDLKKSLAEPRDKLGGLSLITITENVDESNGRLSDIIEITDIWGINMQVISNNSYPRQNLPPPPAKKVGAPRQNLPPKKNHIKKSTSNDVDIGAGAPCIKYFVYGKVKMKMEDYERLVADLGQAWVDKKVPEMDDYIASTGKRYADKARTLRNWHKREQADGSSSNPIEDNRAHAEAIADNFNLARARQKHLILEPLSKGIEIRSTHPTATVKTFFLEYTAKGFRDQLDNGLRKMGLK